MIDFTVTPVEPYFHVHSDGGRFGFFWWVNSDPTPTPLETVWSGWHLSAVGVRWGTCGFGRDIRIHYEPIDD